MNLNITKEKVLQEANKCYEARKLLEVLFPEAFAVPAITIVHPGDVFKHPAGSVNDFVVYETRYHGAHGAPYHLQLLGMGCRINSGKFFENHSAHTPQEVIDYLNECKMVYSHNISNAIFRLLNPEEAKKLSSI